MKRLIAIAMMFGGFFADNAEAQEFDFRGAVLGMTLDEFKALPPLATPRLGQAISCRPSTSGGSTQCSRFGDDPFGTEFRGSLSSYLFGKDASGIERLYMITVLADRNNYATALAGLTEKWGAGDSSESTATNGLGQEIPQDSTTWKKADSTIVLESPCASVTKLCITYIQRRISAEIQAAKGPSKNTF